MSSAAVADLFSFKCNCRGLGDFRGVLGEDFDGVFGLLVVRCAVKFSRFVALGDALFDNFATG